MLEVSCSAANSRNASMIRRRVRNERDGWAEDSDWPGSAASGERSDIENAFGLRNLARTGGEASDSWGRDGDHCLRKRVRWLPLARSNQRCRLELMAFMHAALNLPTLGRSSKTARHPIAD